MDITIRSIKAVRLGLMLVFLILLLWLYAYLPEKLTMGLTSGASENVLFIDRSYFFYIFLGGFALINAIFIAYFNLISGGYVQAIPRLFRPSIQARRWFIFWIGGLHLVLDVFFMTTLLHFGLSNIEDLSLRTADGILLVGPIMISLMLILLILLIIVQGMKPQAGRRDHV